MTWTYAQLKAADAALSLPDLTAAMAALNAQAVATTVDVPISTVEGYMLVNGIETAAKAWLASAAAASDTATAGAVSALLAMIASPRLDTVRMTDPATGTAVKAMLGAMTAAGIMSPTQEATILAMATASVPVWNPPVSEGDIQTARAQP